MGRVYRQGQERPVTVVKLILEDTIDEICIARQSSKLDCIEETLLDARMRSMVLGGGRGGHTGEDNGDGASLGHQTTSRKADEISADTEASAGPHG